MDRLTYLGSRDRRATEQPGRTLAEALATDVPVWLRIRVQYSRGGTRLHTLHAWTARHTPCAPGTTVQQLHAAHPGIDWLRDHDVDTVTGTVYATPEPHEDGWLPETDGTFGDRRQPHVVADRDWFDTAMSRLIADARRAA